MQKNIHEYNNIKNKLLKILIIFLVILFVIAIFCYYTYSKNKKNLNYKNQFIKYMYENDLSFFMDNELVENLIEKIENSNYDLTSSIKIDSNMKNNMFSDVELSNFEFNINYSNNYNNAQKINFNAKYSGNDLLNFIFISNKNQYALKSNEINEKYIGFAKENMQQIMNKTQENKIDFSNFSEIKNFINQREAYKLSEISTLSSLKHYKQIVDENIDDGVYSSRENIIINQNNENKETVEYSLELDSNQFTNLLKDIYEEIDEDNELIKFFTMQNYENKADATVNYGDNENKIIIQSIEQNPNVTDFVWLQNSETNSVNDIDNNTVNNTNTLNIIDNTSINNTTNNIINIDENNNEDSSSTLVIEDNISEETEEEEEEEEVVEEENLRLQGFFSVNDSSNTEYIEDDSEFVIGQNYEETLNNIGIMSGKINWLTYLLTGSKTNLSNYEFAEKIRSIINEKIKSNCSLNVKIYVNEDKTIKYILEIPETKESISMEIIEKAANEKYLIVSYYTGDDEELNGRNISIYKKNSASKKNYSININKILKSKISKKTKLSFEITGTAKDKKNNVTFNLVYSDINGTLKIKTNNVFKFDGDFSVEALDDENCIFLDTLSDEELINTSTELKNKLKSVLSEKNYNLNIISLNSTENIIEHDTENNSESEKTRDELRQILIQHISQKMRDYLDEEKTLKLSDLENMQIDGYDVRISVSENVAVISINGYMFNLDSEFNLSDG